MRTCTEIDRRLRALLDQELPSCEERRVTAHLESCSGCRGRYHALAALVQRVQELPVEQEPPHFTAALQVRLARHRRDRHGIGPLRGIRGRLLASASGARARWTWISVGAVTVAVLALIATQRPLSATEVARRARLSWQQIENYGCVFESRGVYQGQVRSFRQQQFFRRPHEFRLDTAQDYPLSTFVRADRVIHYLPGGVWEGQGPLVLVRPRTAGSTLVPFPFGSTWQPAENVSLERLITALGGELEVRLLGTGRTDEHPYYRLETRIAGPGGRPPDRYQLWIDRKTFLPFRVSWYRDPRNQIVTEARFLETNLAVLPAGTFEFQVPEGAFVVRGDADPHLLALPRDAAPGGDPVGAARGAAARRARGVPFKVFAPQWLPTGFRFVRARRKPGQWIDLHWIRETGPADAVILKLVEERASAAAGMPVGGEQVNLGDDRHPAIAYYSQQNQPFPCNAITWVHGGGRYTLSGVDLTRSDLCRIAGSMRLASLPTRGRAALSMRERSGFRQRRLDHAAPGVLPGSTFDEASSSGPEPAPAGESSSPALPMVPDMAEEDLGR